MLTRLGAKTDERLVVGAKWRDGLVVKAKPKKKRAAPKPKEKQIAAGERQSHPSTAAQKHAAYVRRLWLELPSERKEQCRRDFLRAQAVHGVRVRLRRPGSGTRCPWGVWKILSCVGITDVSVRVYGSVRAPPTTARTPGPGLLHQARPTWAQALRRAAYPPHHPPLAPCALAGNLVAFGVGF